MYSRLTTLTYEPEKEGAAHGFWETDAAKVIRDQPGFRYSVVFSSLESEPGCRALTVWDSKEDFDRFYSGDHRGLNAPLAEVMQVVGRDALELISTTTPHPGEVRLVHIRVAPEEFGDVLEYWRGEGQDLVRAQPGNLGAWALYDDTVHEITLVFAWRRPEDGERFLHSADHDERFGPRLGTRTERISLRRLRLA